MEVAGLVFGVLPILIGVIQGYRDLSEKVHVLRHFSREMRSIQVQFQVQRQAFVNECRLLLRLVVQDKVAKEMIETTQHPSWSDNSLNDQLNNCLRENLETCRNLIDDIQTVLDDFEKQLGYFDFLMTQKKQNETIKSAIRRLRRTVSLPMEKSGYEKTLKKLRDRNNDLSLLRSHLISFQPKRSSSLQHRRAPVSDFALIRSAAQELHEALQTSWRCGDSSHQHHYAKLCLDAEVQSKSAVRLDLAISCQARRHIQNSKAQESPIWLYVRSKSTEDIDLTSSSHYGTPTLENTLSKTHDPSSVILSVKTRKLDSPEGSPPVSAKRRRVRFAEPKDDIEPAFAPIIPPSAPVAKEILPRDLDRPVNLCETKNLCNYLKERLQLHCVDLAECCVGYLQSPKVFRHLFYMSSTQHPAQLPTTTPKSTPLDIVSIEEFLGHSMEDSLNIVDQLKLAASISRAVLKYNSTPWLGDEWHLQNISFFGSKENFSDETLRTLHITTNISDQNKDAEVLPMEGLENNTSVIQEFSLQDYFGINNMVLFSLGVALLELGYWKPLKSLRKENDPNDIITARRLANRCTPLGPKYQSVVNKCLQCNFGFGTDLKKPELQGAVYGDVVCQLESMIESLSI